MQAALRLWILTVFIFVAIYYLYVKRVSEGFYTTAVAQRPKSYGYPTQTLNGVIYTYAGDNPNRYQIGFSNGVAMYIGAYGRDGRPVYAGPVYLPQPNATVTYINKDTGYMYTWPDAPGEIPRQRYGIFYPADPFNNLDYTIDTTLYKDVGVVSATSPSNLGNNTSSMRATACGELKTLQQEYIKKLAEVRTAINDLSGTTDIAMKLKTENMKYQYEFSEECTPLVNTRVFTRLQGIPRSACRDLASVDDPVTETLLQNYDTTNLKIYQEEIKINDNLKTINDTIELTSCDVTEFSFSADNDVGTINTEELREKLNELSPYFISPGTLDFVTKYLVGNGILDTALFSSSEILKSVNSSLSYIKTVADNEFK